MASSKMKNGIKKSVYICSGGILAYLLLTSILSTCIRGTSAVSGKHTFYVKDYPMLHLAAVLILMGVVYWIKNRKPLCRDYDKAIWLAAGIWGAAASLWVIFYMEQPANDSANVLLAARQMRQYNFSSFAGGYLKNWPGNQFLALFFYLLSFFIGVDNYIVLRLLNVAAVMVIFVTFYKIIGELWGKGKRTAFWSVVFCCCFIPALLYTTLIYGDIYGLCLAVMALYGQLRFFAEKKYRWMVFSVLFISLAVQMKMNCIIIWIAMVGISIYEALLKNCWKRMALFLAVLLIGTAGMRTGGDILLRHITGIGRAEGVPAEAWIAMGLQDGEKAAGTFNGYNIETYINNGSDSQKTREEAWKSIGESLQEFQVDPEYAVNFFARKTAAQWNNPDCWTLDNGLEKQIGVSQIKNSVMAGTAKELIKGFLNLFQSWILLGAVCYIIMEKDKSDYEWIFLLIFLGGFFFHLFWEAGARYAFPYYMLLMPYSVRGLFLLEGKLEGIIRKGLEETVPAKRVWGLGGCLLAFVLAGAVPWLNIFGKLVFVAEEKEIEAPVHVEDGYYTISPGGDHNLCLIEADGNIMLMNNEKEQIVSLYRMYENHVIRFMPSQNSLELAGGEDVAAAGHENAFEWRLEPAGESGAYYILRDGQAALAYNLEDWSVKLKEFEAGDEMQIWKLEKEKKRRTY